LYYSVLEKENGKREMPKLSCKTKVSEIPGPESKVWLSLLLKGGGGTAKNFYGDRKWG
jgi:hypothetical protein